MILLSTGLSWYSALLFNLFSSLSAILGFFVGVAAGTASEDANAWILAFAAGLFIYIALVDLVCVRHFCLVILGDTHHALQNYMNH